MRALQGVVRRGGDGQLPAFAATLGLPAPAVAAMRRRYWPQVMQEPAEAPADATSASITVLPKDFPALIGLLLQHRAAGVEAQAADWLAHAMAAACFGEHHLWEELGLQGREDVSCLLHAYFPDLYHKNTQNLRWKRFFFAELGAARGDAALRPPGCSACDHFALCFADDDKARDD